MTVSDMSKLVQFGTQLLPFLLLAVWQLLDYCIMTRYFFVITKQTHYHAHSICIEVSK